MNVQERVPGDLDELKLQARREKDVLRRDRLRAVIRAIEGDDAPTIARVLGRSRRQVQDWAYAYRDRGIDAIHPPKRPGKTARVNGPTAERLRSRLDAGPTAKDKVCTLRGKDVQRILREEMDVKLSLNAAYATLHRLGYSCLAPRPRHEKQDPAAQEKFRTESAPLLSGSSATRSLPSAESAGSSSWTKPGSASRAP
jgi:transposase